ncbi:MAG: radical SAM protein [Candidatus Krumholzibacteria bacterium]|nr:radical SAM protein [Candidatus Krumholzibacteria bacterium]
MRIRYPARAFKNIFIRKALIEAQLIVTRRCNLSCGYCTEYDNHSKSIPFNLIADRIDALHRLGVVQIALLGGEPMMHEDIDKIVLHAGRYAQTSMTTNGFLVGGEIIERLNKAGLSHMQVSIDTLKPSGDMYIQKSMKTIHNKLELLRRTAKFSVHANIVLCEESQPDFKELVSELRRLNIPVTVNLLHDDRGRVSIGGDSYVDLWEHHHRTSKVISFIEYEYGKELLTGKSRQWSCRAGSRHLYVDEFGNAQFCASQRGRLNKPIVECTPADLQHYGNESKGCEDGCAVFCVYRASQLENDPVGLAKALLKSLRNRTLSFGSRSRDGRHPSSNTPLEHAGKTERA